MDSLSVNRIFLRKCWLNSKILKLGHGEDSRLNGKIGEIARAAVDIFYIFLHSGVVTRLKLVLQDESYFFHEVTFF